MVQINLLPWREERRERLKTEFFVILGVVVGVAIIIIGIWHFLIDTSIQGQRFRSGIPADDNKIYWSLEKFLCFRA